MSTPWLEWDRQHSWHPYTRLLTSPEPVPIERGEGPYLITSDGRRILDAISSWWVNIHGHTHPRLVRALAEQSSKLQQVIFAGFTHEPAARLAHELVERSPEGLDRVFYSDNGSTAVEVALKMAIQYWRNRGEPERTLFVHMKNAYHGDTVGTMSVSGVSTFRGHFQELLFESREAHAPTCPECPVEQTCPRCAIENRAELRDILAEEGDRVAAVIIEPMLQGAAGMIVWPAEFLRYVRRVTEEAGIPLIADEVFTGFGRTGTMFACEHGPVTPDMMCLSKALTAGYLPLAATLCTSAIYQEFEREDPNATFLHGHSFTANPLACAVALESLAIFDEDRCLERVGRLELLYRKRMEEVAQLPAVTSVRVLGGMAAAVLHPGGGTGTAGTSGSGGYFDELGPHLYREFMRRDILLRPLGNVLYVLPPYVVEDEDVDRIFDAVVEVVGAL